MHYNPYNSIRKWKYTEVYELLLVLCDKDSEFFGPSKTKLEAILLLVHVSTLNNWLLF